MTRNPGQKIPFAKLKGDFNSWALAMCPKKILAFFQPGPYYIFKMNQNYPN